MHLRWYKAWRYHSTHTKKRKVTKKQSYTQSFMKQTKVGCRFSYPAISINFPCWIIMLFKISKTGKTGALHELQGQKAEVHVHKPQGVFASSTLLLHCAVDKLLSVSFPQLKRKQLTKQQPHIPQPDKIRHIVHQFRLDPSFRLCLSLKTSDKRNPKLKIEYICSKNKLELLNSNVNK